MVYFAIAITICAMFAFLETTITKMRLFNIKEIKSSTPKYLRLLTLLEENPQQVLIGILIATNMASITAAVITQNLIENICIKFSLPEGVGFSIGIAIATMLTSVLGEIIPKSIAQSQGPRLFTSTLWLTNLLSYISWPIAQPLNYFIQRISKSQNSNDVVTEKEIRFLIDYIEQEGDIDNHKTYLLQNIFRMTSTCVKEIVIPKSEIISISIDSDPAEMIALFEEYQFSRLPVYKKDQENIVGIIYQKDFFLAMQRNSQTTIKDLVRPIIFVPDSLKVNELIKDFKLKKIHMGIVMDEYGSTVGLVTLEDALEEIVGDISDEHDDDSLEKIKVIEPNQEWLVDATIDLDRLKEYLKIPFRVESSVTLGGFLTERMQYLPEKEECFYYKGYSFNIEKADKKRIISVRVTVSEESEECSNKKKKDF
jgi:putative hemolysin